jgi:hypothetical protein
MVNRSSRVGGLAAICAVTLVGSHTARTAARQDPQAGRTAAGPQTVVTRSCGRGNIAASRSG